MIEVEQPIAITAPSFVAKLWSMVNNPDFEQVIAWTKSGKSFVIKDKFTFTYEILPAFFKHSNLSSFIRQLNKYGFRKLQFENNREELEFAHENFSRDDPFSLQNMKVKHTVKHSDDALKDLLDKVHTLKKSQDTFESKIGLVQKETKALCKETENLKKKQQVQQKIINNIMAFLVNMMAHNEGDVNIPVMFSNAPNNSSTKNIMAITQKPHIAQKQTESGQLFSSDSQEIFDFILNNENRICVEGCESPIVINPPVDEDSLMEGFSEDSQAVKDGNYESQSSSDLTSSEIQQLVDSNVELQGISPSPNIEPGTSPEEMSGCIDSFSTADLDFDKLCIPSSLDSATSPMDQNSSTGPGNFIALLPCDGTAASSHSNVGYNPIKNELDDHVSVVESNLNDLKEIMKSANLNFDVDEIIELFTPEELALLHN